MQMQATRPVAASRPATRPEFAAILGRVRKLRPEIESRALATAKAKRVSAETMEALRDADVFRMMQPARFGGFEYGPAELGRSDSNWAAPAAVPAGAGRWRFVSAG